ncbi:E3 ubiquitin-protein ligase Praja-2 [Morus bassanus]
MGQEAGKPVWLEAAGGYQTITAFCEGSSPLGQAASGLLDKPSVENIESGEPICRSVSSQTCDVDASPFSLFSYDLEGNRISGNFMNPCENSGDLAEYASGRRNDLNGQNGIAFVNIDSYKPDSSGAEEDDAQDKFYLAREEASVFPEALAIMLSELVRDPMPFSGLQSQSSTLGHSVENSRECCEEVGAMPVVRYFSIDSDLACLDNRTFKSSAEGQGIPRSNLNGANYEAEQINTVDVGVGTPLSIDDELNVGDGNTDQGNLAELVVRPKIRKQNTANELEREKLLPVDDEKEGASWWRNEIAEDHQGRVECAFRNSEEKMSSSMFFDSKCEDHQNTEVDLRKNAAAQDQKYVLDDSTFRDKFEDCSRHLSVFYNDEHSSECSDGEWSTAVLAYFTGMEKDQSSSDESWETVPGREEHNFQVQSSSSCIEVVNTNFYFHGGEQMLLEEGEIPWLRYREQVGSSSDEDDPVSGFVHPGFFLLDGNNNLEDDSSVSEDLDVEWSLLDEFGEGLGLTQAIPYVNSEFLTLMALEGRLQEAVETALAHLESLGLDVDQAHPPATKETIDSLPQIVITDDHEGQEQRCTICCSEYVKDEIITELPCHHLFHNPCVTVWLQNSGTCPVCRHVLAPVLPEAAAATVSDLSDNDSTSSIQSATEASK